MTDEKIEPKDELGELRSEINKSFRKRADLIIKVDKLTKEIGDLYNQIYRVDPNYVDIQCGRCGGTGIIINPEDSTKKILCDICGGRKYNWALKYGSKNP